MNSEIIVVGGGIIGTSTAYYLSKLGAKVTLVESKDIASGTSGACDQAIMLQSKKPGPTLELAKESAKIYSTLEEELNEKIEYKKRGGMIVIETVNELDAMKAMVERQQNAGVNVQIISGDEARKRQPGLSEHIIGATWWDHDAEVNPLKVCLAMAKAAKRNGAVIRTRAKVMNLIVENNSILGVNLAGEKLYADHVVLSQGVWTPFLLKQLGIDIPIIPRKGQILVSERMNPFIRSNILSASYITSKLTPKETDPEKPKSAGLSLSQTDSGTLLIGSSREFVGFNVKTNPILTKDIAKVAARIFPVLKYTRIIRSFAGLRPYTTDGMPVIGQIDGIAGLYIAAGHEGDGIALGPITGKITANLVYGNQQQIDVSTLSPNRFLPNSIEHERLKSIE